MTDCIAVLNAGSSSIKFALHDAQDEVLLFRGQIESIGLTPRLTVKDAAGTTVAERSWPESGLDHPGATQEIVHITGELLGGRYRIVAMLGKGGMGEVYRADDLSLDQPVALKFLPEAVTHHEPALERFRGEVRIAPHTLAPCLHAGEPDELGRELGQALCASLCPAVLDRNIATLDPAELAQSLHKGADPSAVERRRVRAQESDGR